MPSRKSIDFGLGKALSAGSHSPHPYARSVIANYERCREVCTKSSKTDEFAEGEIPFGFIEDGSAETSTIARLRLDWIRKHILVIGPSGSGKSTLTRVLADGGMDYVPMMIFDRTDDHYNCYSRHSPLVFPIRHLRFNPNEEPPGVPYEEYLAIFSSVFINSLILTDVSRGSFVQLVRYTNEKFRDKLGDRHPSIYEQRLCLQDLKPSSYKDHARAVYWSKLEDRFDNIINGTLGEVFGCYKGHDLIELLNRNIVFDCKGISSHELRILVSLIITKIYSYRLYNNQGNKLLHCIILEEAEDIFSDKNSSGFLENPIDDLVRRCRGRGEGLLVINQTVSNLSMSLRSNVFVQFMLGATNALERSEMGRSIGLREDQWKDALNLEAPPNAFVAIQGRTPLLVSIPEYKFDRTSVPQNTVSSPNDLTFVPVPDEFKKVVFDQIFNTKHKTMADLKDERGLVDQKKMLELMSDIAKNPFVTLTSRRNLSYGKSTSDLFRVKDKAVAEDYIHQIVTKATRGPGQKGIYLELTRKGMDLLIENDLWKKDKPYYAGKMGYSGALLLNCLIKSYFEESGRKTVVEGINRGYDCDLGVLGDNDSLELAVELSVHTSAKHEIENVLRNFAAGWKKVLCVVVAFEKNEKEIVESEIRTDEKQKAFTDYFEIHLPKEHTEKVQITTIKSFRNRSKS